MSKSLEEIEYFARKIKVDDENISGQSLFDHIDNVVQMMGNEAEQYNLSSTAKIIGFIHDLGKFSDSWQKYLDGSVRFEKKRSKKLSHSLTGIAYIIELIPDKECLKSSSKRLLREVIIYVVGAHHGLFDCLTIEGESLVKKKIEKAKIEENSHYIECKEKFEKEYGKDIIRQLIIQAENEMNGAYIMIKNGLKAQEENIGIFKMKERKKPFKRNYYSFYFNVFIRYLLSIMMNSDWSDAAIYENKEYHRWNFKNHKDIFLNMQTSLENKISTFSNDNDIDKLRKKISDECLESGSKEIKIRTLNVPTGSGKTLAVMRYALEHAIKYNKIRIFYCAPYMSILEQNAEEYRKSLVGKDDISNVILEHHSNVTIENDNEDEYRVEKERYEYLSDNWSSPMILTTMVQFLNTLFLGKKQSIRRFHQIANSVVVIDEIQKLPIKTTALFNTMVNILAECYNTTFVFCTATQPPLADNIQNTLLTIPSIIKEGNSDLTRDYSKEIPFVRTIIKDKTKISKYNVNELCSMINERLKNVNSLLVVMNTTKAVSEIYKELKNLDKDYQVIALSAKMTPEHRKKKLDGIEKKLGHERIVCISSQLIEAGVDISFEGAIRSLAGLDSISQVAGRVNRHGERNIGEVWIINADESLENLSRLKEIKSSQEALYPILRDFKDYPEKYDDNIISDKSMDFYFKAYYKNMIGEAFYKFGKPENNIFSLLGYNQKARDAYVTEHKMEKYIPFLAQRFYTAGKNFEVIDSATHTIVVPWGKGAEILKEFLSYSIDYKKLNKLLEKLQLYCINVHDYELLKLKEEKAIITDEDRGVMYLKEGYYSEDLGFQLEGVPFDLCLF